MKKSIRWLLPIAALLLVVPLLTLAQNGADESCAPSRLMRGWPNTDFCQNNVNFNTIISGGVPKDAIPAITDPNMETVEQAADWLVDVSPVISVEINGEARAYPQAILTWHEIVNDSVGDVPVSVTFCPLCNSSIVFDRRLGDAVLDFGVSGNLRNSDMIMYDRQTESWWQQLTGEAIVGEYTGTFLDIVPSQVIGFGQFAEQYPEGLVMSRETGFSRRYGINPYAGYDQLEQPFLFREETDERLPATERVLAGIVAGQPVAYPFSVISDEIVVNDTINETPVVVLWQPGVASALGFERIDEARDIGLAVMFNREVGGEVLNFTWDDESSALVDDLTNSTWNIFGEAISGELEGTRLKPEIAAPHFWFAWAAFHPETIVYGIE